VSRRAPRRLALALEGLAPQLAPATPLARIQEEWAAAAGPAIAAAARPVSERDGVVTVLCEAAVWAAELELLGDQVVARINQRLGPGTVRGMRCRTG
jgi:predicted nucleic acid-binding Zn ribbon protein